jgi:hypothetical protein
MENVSFLLPFSQIHHEEQVGAKRTPVRDGRTVRPDEERKKKGRI